jgi:hypothetical protein
LNKIKFSHHYPKLWKQTKAILIDIRILDAGLVQTNLELLHYDTVYHDEDYWGYYDLSSEGDLIQLIFIGNYDIPFCTLRRHTKQKYDYYRNLLGQEFEIEVKK